MLRIVENALGDDLGARVAGGDGQNALARIQRTDQVSELPPEVAGRAEGQQHGEDQVARGVGEIGRVAVFLRHQQGGQIPGHERGARRLGEIPDRAAPIVGIEDVNVLVGILGIQSQGRQIGQHFGLTVEDDELFRMFSFRSEPRGHGLEKELNQSGLAAARATNDGQMFDRLLDIQIAKRPEHQLLVEDERGRWGLVVAGTFRPRGIRGVREQVPERRSGRGGAVLLGEQAPHGRGGRLLV